ncbi:MAG: TonB-dependent receptor [Sphingobium sp.]
MNIKNNNVAQMMGGSAIAAVLLTAVPAAAQEAPAAEAVTDGGDIVVTARKSSESILKTPIAVSALTSDDLAVRGVVSLNDLSATTPGVNINNNAAGRNDRSFQQLIIRGFTPSQATNPTAALFIDGAPVSSTSAFSTVSDPERVEVLKGPQAAYFGRNTFAGAINFVNKEPKNEFSGSVSGMVGTRRNYKLHADVGGALIDDVLLVRLGVDRVSKDGSWRNQFSGETLGDQRTTSASALVVFKPTPDLKIKAFGLLSDDKDGPSAQGQLSAVTVRDSAGNVVLRSQSNCVLNGANASFCGVTPQLATGPSANTNTDAYVQNFLANPRGRVVSPGHGVQEYGLVRRYYHAHIGVDYDFPDLGLTLSSLTGYNNERYSQLADIDQYGSVLLPNTSVRPGARSYYDYPFLVERLLKDFSQEFRATYDQGGAFKGTVGVSYLNAFAQGSLGGGNGGLGVSDFSSVSGATRNRTLGAFFGATYKFIEGLSLSLEGRYQIDKISAWAPPTGFTANSDVFVPRGFYQGESQLLSATYKNFLPRAILQYDINPSVMVYASYSKGVNPGAFNTAFLSFSRTVQQAAADAGVKVRVDPEKVTNYEIGVKGKMFDNKLRFALAAYYAPWRNQINAITLTANDDPGAAPASQIIRYAANTGSVDMKGVELEGTFTVSRAIAVNFSGAINDSSINAYANPQVTALTGIRDFKGKENPNTSKYAAALGVQYNGTLGVDSSWFVRTDYNFKSGVFADAANTVRTPDLHLVNARLGFDHGPASLSLFVRNVFNNHTYVSIANANVLAPGVSGVVPYNGLIVGLPELRTFGLEWKFRF